MHTLTNSINFEVNDYANLLNLKKLELITNKKTNSKHD
jgi:hypothetical protein